MQGTSTGRSEHDQEARTPLRVHAVAAVLFAMGSILCAAMAAAEEEAQGLRDLDGLAWMAGCWGSSDGPTSADECWLERRGNMMLGFHVDVFANGRTFFEYLRIVAEGDDVDYLASPMGGSATPFRLVEIDGQRAVFENPHHDWPQRLTYWRDGDRLHARAEGLDDTSRKAQWVWQRRPDS